ncbi:O-antigen ligase family protein, partial [Peribacillus sp. NPDC055009]
VAMGIVNDNRFLNYEIQLYPFLIIKICAFIGWIKTFKIGMSTLIHGFVLSSLCYSIFTILLYFFGQNILNDIYGSFYGDIWNSSGRVGFKNTTVLLIINLFSIYMIYSQKRIVLNLVNIILGSTSILISQTRSIIILYLLILLVLFVSFIIKSALSNLNPRTYLIFSIASFTIPFVFIIGFIVFNTDTLLIDSVKSRMFESNGGSLDSRKYTNQYNIGMIENNIIGDGLGKEMYFLGSNSQLNSIDTWIDNLFIYILVKFGLIGLILFILMVIIGLFKYIKEALIKKNVLSFIILIAYVPFIIITTFMTSQLLHSQQVYITFAFLYFICCKEKYFKNINKNVV